MVAAVEIRSNPQDKVCGLTPAMADLLGTWLLLLAEV